MPKNESGFDRLLRLVIGLALLALVFVGPKTPWGLLGLIPIITAFVGYCPAYRACGISTYHRNDVGA